MGEFLEYLRQKHYKGKDMKKVKRLKPRDEILDGDSVSEITDLSKEDILTSSMHKLSVKERAKLIRL